MHIKYLFYLIYMHVIMYVTDKILVISSKTIWGYFSSAIIEKKKNQD
jgi:hypothetical protein